ncbi:MAG TPA: histone deacetylase [Candidatus Acidoferrales bacterium]|nr:histone deacetylase [Candidatus Acidoferrales bacterium]
MLPFKLVYHEGYDLHLGEHVFPSMKYKLIRDSLFHKGIADEADFLQPEPIEDADVLAVHDESYIHKIKTNGLSPMERMRLEIPAGAETQHAFWLAAGGTLLSARSALNDGFAANLSGGFHHAFADHGEGFCMLHDVAIAVRRLQAEGKIRTAMTIDTDVHHGNGTAAIFARDKSVFTLSIHQENNYPNPKPPSNIDLNLPDRIDDADYLAILESGVLQAFDEFQPDVIFYIGGADPYRQDKLGGLSLSIEGLMRRDKLVFEHSRKRNVPVVITLAGGYAWNIADTVQIHVNTVVAARDVANSRTASKRA